MHFPYGYIDNAATGLGFKPSRQRSGRLAGRLSDIYVNGGTIDTLGILPRRWRHRMESIDKILYLFSDDAHSDMYVRVRASSTSIGMAAPERSASWNRRRSNRSPKALLSLLAELKDPQLAELVAELLREQRPPFHVGREAAVTPELGQDCVLPVQRHLEMVTVDSLVIRQRFERESQALRGGGGVDMEVARPGSVLRRALNGSGGVREPRLSLGHDLGR